MNSLMDFLKSTTKHLPCTELSKRRPLDAKIFSSIHVDYPQVQYGTRNRSIILIDHDNHVDYVEERLLDDSTNWERKWLQIGNESKKFFNIFRRSLSQCCEIH